MLSELINWKVIVYFIISCLILAQSLGTQSAVHTWVVRSQSNSSFSSILFHLPLSINYLVLQNIVLIINISPMDGPLRDELWGCILGNIL